MTSNRSHVSRLANIVDLIGVILLVAGGGLYLRAYMGMSALQTNGGSLSKARNAGLVEYDSYWQLSRYGLWLGAFALVVLVAGAVLTARAKRAAATPPHDTVPATP